MYRATIKYVAGHTFVSPVGLRVLPTMHSDSAPVDERPVGARTDEHDIKTEHRQAQESGEVFEGRRHSDR